MEQYWGQILIYFKNQTCNFMKNTQKNFVFEYTINLLCICKTHTKGENSDIYTDIEVL